MTALLEQSMGWSEVLTLPLVLFTVFSQIAIGLALISATRQWAVSDAPDLRVRVEWVTIGGLLALAIGASLLHLGDPWGAVRALNNLQSAWLSREILGVILFGLLIAAIFFTELRRSAPGWLLKLCALIGLATLFATGMTYSIPPNLPAINNGLPLLLFALTALILGTAFGSYFAQPRQQPRLFGALVTALLIALAVNLVAPSIWSSGGAVMQQTAQNYLTSPIYWGYIGVGLVIPLLVLWRLRRIPAWLPILLLIGEVTGRIAFFVLMATSAENLGQLY
jgi:DMSO reductase anchor subunit